MNEKMILMLKNNREMELLPNKKIQGQSSNSNNTIKKLKKMYHWINVCRDKINQTVNNNIKMNVQVTQVSVNPIVHEIS